LKRKLDAEFLIIQNGIINFYYNEEYLGSGNLTYNLYDYTHQIVLSNTSASITGFYNGYKPYRINYTIPLQYKDNYCTINLQDSGLNAGYYILEVINSKNEKFYLRIKNNQTLSTISTN